MALTEVKTFHGDAEIHALGKDGNAEIFSKSERRRFGSEVEVVNGVGKLIDVIFSGEEITTTETKIGEAFTEIGEGDIETGIVTRSSVRFSNEDVSKVETEKLRIPLSA